jgi:hypothetical protein
LRLGGERANGQGECGKTGRQARDKAGAGVVQDMHRSFLSVDIAQNAVKGFAEK